MCKFVKQSLVFIGFLLATTGFSQGWRQVGTDIQGEAAGDKSGGTRTSGLYYGMGVCMPDKNTLAIGARGNSDKGSNSGHVRVFTFNGTSWVQKGLDIDGEAAEDMSGWCVAMPDSNTVAIGAPLNDGDSVDNGHVRVYSWSGSSWVQKGADINGEAYKDLSGTAISMPNNSTIAIGATNNKDNGTLSGHVRVYTWSGTNWIQKGLDIDGEASGDLSGWTVSMPDENTVAIGAFFSFPRGYVRVYSWNGNAWIQMGADIDGHSNDHFFGFSVSMPDSFTLAVGAPRSFGGRSGLVRIYSWNGTSWNQRGSDIVGEAQGDEFGTSVSMPNSNTVAIGAIFNNDNGINSGHTRVYKWDGLDWIQLGLDIDGQAPDDFSGLSVSMPDTSTVAIGAPLNDGNGIDAGHVRVYRLCSKVFINSSVNACREYSSPSGKYTWNASGTYYDTLPGTFGCDTLLTINLTIDSVLDLGVLNNSPTLKANESDATYQWVDCQNDYAPISGETGQSFTARKNGVYAVILSKDGCMDTSDCVLVSIDDSEMFNYQIGPITNNGSPDSNNNQDPILYIPNSFSPNGDGLNDQWHIANLPKENEVWIFNRWGELVFTQKNYDGSWKGIDLGGAPLRQGIYVFRIRYHYYPGIDGEEMGSVQIMR